MAGVAIVRIGKRDKFGRASKEERTLDGITFDSKAEMRRWNQLQLLLKCGGIRDLRRQVPFVWSETLTNEATGATMTRQGRYVADFVYIDALGKEHIEDVKGHETREYKRKRRVMRALFNVTIEEIKPSQI